MIDQADERTDELAAEPADEPGEQPAEAVRTGNEAADDVLESLDGLDDLPVDEHVAVFERAHEQLRAALDSPRDD